MGEMTAEVPAGEVVDAATPDEPVVVEVPAREGEAIVQAATEGEPAKPDLDAYDRETVRLVNVQEQAVAEAEAAFVNARERAADLKKMFEAKQSDLRGLIRRRKEFRGKPEQKTLVDDIAPPDEGNEPHPADIPPTPVEAKDESWKAVPLSEWVKFGATEKDIQCLADNNPPITTVGELAAFIVPNPANPGFAKKLTDIKNVGEKRAERLQEAEAKFWAFWASRA